MSKEQQTQEIDISSLKKEIESQRLEIDSKNAELKEVTEKHKRLVDQLRDKLECPVCLEVPRAGPVHVCPNGHLVCTKCKTGSCPTCRVPMGANRSLLAVTVIENIGHECVYDDCSDLFTPDKLEQHAKICQHRTVTCPYELCREHVGLSKLLEHMVGSDCCLNTDPIVIGASWISPIDFMAPGFEESDWTWKPSVYSIENMVLVIFPQVVDDFYFFPVVLFGSVQECSNYSIEVVVQEINSACGDSDVSFKYCGQPTSIDECKVGRKYMGLTVNKYGMAKILKKSKDEEFRVFLKIN